MNGKMMPESANEMQALIAYMDWLGRATPANGKIEGQGFLEMEIPERAVDLVDGETVFIKHCVLCHGADGQGQKYRGTIYIFTRHCGK